MKRLTTIVVLAVAFSTVGFSQSVRTFVASFGSDTNPCSRTAPCRQFSAAMGAVNTGGEVVALDSAGYGPVTIDRSITITAPGGVHAAIAPTSGSAILVNPGISGPVVIRNLFLNGQGASEGIRHEGISPLSVSSCTISGFTGNGILFLPPTDGLKASASESLIRNCGNGIQLLGFFSAALTVDRCRLEKHVGYGVLNASWGKIGVRQSAASFSGGGFAVVGNGGEGSMDLVDSSAYRCGNGFYVLAVLFADNLNMNLEHCVASRNDIGLHASVDDPGAAVLRVSNSNIVGNTTGVAETNGGIVASRGNNTLESNPAGNTFANSYTAK